MKYLILLTVICLGLAQIREQNQNVFGNYQRHADDEVPAAGRSEQGEQHNNSVFGHGQGNSQFGHGQGHIDDEDVVATRSEQGDLHNNSAFGQAQGHKHEEEHTDEEEVVATRSEQGDLHNNSVFGHAQKDKHNEEVNEVEPAQANLETVLEQYTPNQADWSTFYSKPATVGNTSHDPDGVWWLSAASWEAAKWDGQPIDPRPLTNAQFKAAICPKGDTIRGLREVFYSHNPFADNKNPTKAEVDDWHRIVINHVRALTGDTDPERQAKKDHCMFARALWGDQRKFTTQWDAKYPGTFDSAYGPCVGGRNGHCGATFIPDYEDQRPYLPEGHPGCTRTAGSEGVTGGPKSNIPWAIKISRAICSFLGEGYWGGHPGPFFRREKFGFNFWDNDPNNVGNNAIFRGKWTGRLFDHLYVKP